MVKVYVDAGISGKRMDTRKELLAALASQHLPGQLLDRTARPPERAGLKQQKSL
jgi:hypothetical protein